MIFIRHAHERGRTKLDWLDSYHTFSFGEYYDSKYVSFHNLRVINEDFVKPSGGFPTHPHQDMEILTYLLNGSLEHRDSMGNGSIIKAGEIQRMSAGMGVRHSEYNPSNTEPVHFLQIWLYPEKKRLIPSYEQRGFTNEQLQNNFCLIASHDGRENSITINQTVDLYATKLDAHKKLTYLFNNNHYGWFQVVQGKVNLNNIIFNAGDGAGITDEKQIELIAEQDAEFLLFDLK